MSKDASIFAWNALLALIVVFAYGLAYPRRGPDRPSPVRVQKAVSPEASAGDPSTVDIDLAKGAYEAKIAQARQAVLVRYQELIGEQEKRHEARQVELLTNEMKLFDGQGIFNGRAEFMQVYIAYTSTAHEALVALRKAYVDAIENRLSAKRQQEAESLEKALAELPQTGELKSFQLSSQSRWLSHANYLGVVEPRRTPEDLNMVFEVLPGLADPQAVSIRSVNFPQHYLAHGDFRIRMQRFEDSLRFRENATFKRKYGPGGSSEVFFESLNYPEMFITARGSEVRLQRSVDPRRFQQNATFQMSEPVVKLWDKPTVE